MRQSSFGFRVSGFGFRVNPKPATRNSKQLCGGQGTMEYLLVMVAVLLAVLFAAQAGGPIQSAVGTVLSDTSSVIDDMVTQVSQRF